MTKLAISVAEFCETIGVGRTKAFQLISDGTLETLKIGRRTLIKMSSVEALLQDNNSDREAGTPGGTAMCNPTGTPVSAR